MKVFNIHPSTHEAHEHGVGLGAVNFKNSVKMQQCSAQSLAQRRAESLQGVGNPEA